MTSSIASPPWGSSYHQSYQVIIKTPVKYKKQDGGVHVVSGQNGKGLPTSFQMRHLIPLLTFPSSCVYTASLGLFWPSLDYADWLNKRVSQSVKLGKGCSVTRL
jgi:hypothetical protein